MEVQKEAQRIMTMSVWKMYHSRMQRGGLRLHRSLQLSLVMRNARDLYLSAKLEEGEEMGGGGGTAGELPLHGEAPCPPHLDASPPPSPFPQAHQEGLLDPEPMETQQEGPDGGLAPQPPPHTAAWSRSTPRSPTAGPAKPSRKRRSSSLGKLGAAEAGLVPSKKAKLVEEEEGERQPQRQEGPFPSLARVLQDRFSGLILQTPPGKGSDEPKAAASCRQGDGMLSVVARDALGNRRDKRQQQQQEEEEAQGLLPRKDGDQRALGLCSAVRANDGLWSRQQEPGCPRMR